MLGFVEEPYPAAQQAELLHSFRTRGYMVLPDVFADADSVAAFRRRVVEKAAFIGTLASLSVEDRADLIRLVSPPPPPRYPR